MAAASEVGIHVSLKKIIDGPDFLLKTKRCENVRDSARKVLLWIDQFTAEYTSFNEEIMTLLHAIVDTEAKVSFSKKEKMWKKFHSLRVSEHFLEMWSKFLSVIKLEVPADPIMAQFITQDMLEMTIKNHTPSLPVPEQDHSVQPTKEELNALRYAAGYVLRSVSLKYKSRSNDKSDEVLSTLREMEAKLDDDDDDDEVKCTTEWTNRLDRGKLVKVSDMFYALLLSIEVKVRLFFNNTVMAQVSSTDNQMLPKEQLITTALEDVDVQFYWSIMSVDLEEETSQELLHEIVQLWVTIRGFSFTKSWLEKYRTSKCQTDAKKKGLRKNLQRKEKDGGE